MMHGQQNVKKKKRHAGWEQMDIRIAYAAIATSNKNTGGHTEAA